MVAAHGVQDQPLVGLEHVAREAGVVHGELQAQLVQPHAGSRPLAVEGQRHLGGVGQVEGQVVGALGADARADREHALGRLAEGDRDDALALGQPLAGAQEERHPRPAPVVDHALEGDEGLGVGFRIDPLLLAIAVVLAADHVARIDRHHGAKDLVLLLADGLGLQRRGRLHGHEGQDLEQVGDHHVAIGAGLLVEGRPAAEAERLWHVDLDVVDEGAVPDRLEQAVGKAEGEDVLGRLLAQEVVDAEDLRLVEHLVQARVQRPGALQVGAERLFHDDARALDQLGFAQHPHGRQGGARRHAQIVQPLRLAPQRRFGLQHLVPQRLGSRRQGNVVEPLGEGGPVRGGDFPRYEFVDGGAGEGAEGLRVEGVQRHADDAAIGNEAGAAEAEHPRQQLAARQVAGRAEQDDHLRMLGPHAGQHLDHMALRGRRRPSQ